MTVTFLLRARCFLCGYQLRGVSVRKIRVNKRTLRTLGVGLGAVDRHCPECGTPAPDRYTIAGLDPADAARVQERRAAA